MSKVFDDMVRRSVPYYDQVQHLIVDFLKKRAENNWRIYDLGCSTSNTLIRINNELEGIDCTLFGIDNSLEMIQRSSEKLNDLTNHNITLICSDILEYPYEKANCFILNLVLQFIRPIERQSLLAKLYNSLEDNGMVFVFEKVIEEHPDFTRIYIDLYYEYKRSQNYSEIEIARKREELENVLIPFSCNENYSLLKRAGFTKISTIFKYLNFSVYVAMK